MAAWRWPRGRGSNRRMHPFQSVGVMGPARWNGGASYRGETRSGRRLWLQHRFWRWIGRELRRKTLR